MSGLQSIDLSSLETVRLTQEETEMAVDVNFPSSSEFPASAGLDLEGGHNVVYFEIEPGKELATHTDSPEELIVCLDGADIEAWAGDATGTLEAGQLAVIPPMAPHGFRNEGDETARILGIFSDATNVSEFDHEIQPFGQSVVKG